jgi:hypothetical protein
MSTPTEIPVPNVRVRVNHGYTLKSGWRCNDTTVDVVVPADELAVKDLGPFLAHLLREAHQVGLDEASRRNAQEGVI